MKTKPTKNQNGFAPIAIVVVAVLAIIGFLAYQNLGKNVPTSKITMSTSQPQSFFSKLLGQKPPTPTKMILGVMTTRTFDPKTNKGGVPVTSFTTKDPDIFVVLEVNKPPKDTKFEYVRYFQGKYVDHGSLTTTKAGVDYVSFNWSLKMAANKRLLGTYLVKLYTQGNFEKEISYQVR